MERRSGYTLFEVALVVSIVVIVGALAVPVMKPMFASNNLQAASDLLRARWAEMRTRAISDGRSYRFSIAESTGKFRIAPEDFESGQGEASAADARPWIVEETLPGKILFVSTESSPNGESSGGQSGSAAANGSWTRVVTFLANGTAREDVQVSFGPSGSRPMVLKLRGATGSVTAEEPGAKGHRT